MVRDYLLGGAIVVVAYLAFVLVWSTVESVTLIVRGVRRWWHRNDLLILGTLWPREVLEAFRRAVDNPSSDRPD